MTSRHKIKTLAIIFIQILVFVSSELFNTVELKNTSVQDDYHLPNTIIPKSYVVQFLDLNPNNPTFSGSVKIKTFVANATDRVVLHHDKSIKIDEFQITILNSVKHIRNLGHFYDAETEKFTVILNDTLPIDSGTDIELSFNGVFANNLRGLYQAPYSDKHGAYKYAAATQFHSIFARKAFPCFDEPRFRTDFTIIVRRPKSLTSLSNMPIDRTTPISEDTMSDIFQTSVPMPTYLVAIFISDFVMTCDPKNELRVWSHSLALNQTEFALNHGLRVRDFLSKLFNQFYPLRKMDMVAVPEMFHSAMENWGIITFRDDLLLFDKMSTSAIDQQNIASTITHEWTHMWFGNLVTPESWGCAWMSEGFANYFEYFGLNELMPDWKMDQQYVIEQLHSALINDADDSSKPMTRLVKSSKEIIESGDVITYSKAGSIIRMMNLTFGTSVFINALQSYLKNRKFGTSDPDDLWSSFQEQIDNSATMLPTNVATIMNSWTKQPGFPVINVMIENGVAELHQRRFFIRNPTSIPANATWWQIPLTWTTESNPDFDNTVPKYWFNQPDDIIDLNTKKDGWIIFNVKRAGYYRVNYDRKSWNLIINALNSDSFEKISVINRAAIIDDLLNLARSGFILYDDALNGLKYIRKESHYLPIKSALNGLEYLYNRFAGRDDFKLFRKFVSSLITPIYERLGYNDKATDDHLTILLRTELNKWACKLSHKTCTNASLGYFETWLKNSSNIIPRNQKEVVFCTAVSHGPSTNQKKAIETIKNIYKFSIIPTERRIALKSFSCIRDPAELKTILESAITRNETSSLRRQDSAFIVKLIAERNHTNAEIVLDFIAQNHEKMIKYYNDNQVFNSIVTTVLRMLTTPNGIQKIEQFLKNQSSMYPSLLDSLVAHINLTKYEHNFYETYHRIIVSWIKNYNLAEKTTEKLKYRLPKKIVPKSYKIQLTPHIVPGNFTFNGRVEIIATVVADTTEIVLHIDNITYKDIALDANGTHIPTTSIVSNEKYQFLMITTGQPLVANTVLNITITYTGFLNSDSVGFYRSSYVNKSNKTIWLAATKLEPTYARMVFPCFDEPAFKATFQINVNRLPIYKTLSNTRLKMSIPKGDRVLDVFEPTPIMSTYLVAIVISDLSASSIDPNYLVWAKPTAIDQVEYASSLMKPITNFLESSLKINYSLPKLDMVALPDFSSGAMENWGLITYKEKLMLYDPDRADIIFQQAIAYIINHEIAHQWFGNLVTLRWWKDTWLNEGFARYFQQFAVAKLKPNWKPEIQFVVDYLQPTFLIDSTTQVHAVSHDVYTPKEIRNMFDVISYAKGGCILRMIEKSFGSKIFYSALTDYLTKNQYKSVSPEDLYLAFQRQINISAADQKILITPIFESWINQPGFPVLNVSIFGNKVTLSQQRFISNISAEILTNSTWWIPITWTTNVNSNFSDTTPKYWLKRSEDFITINDNDWVIFNIQQAGYYRVNYDSASWLRIIEALKSKDYNKIHEINRASILDDLFNLAKVGQVDYATAFSASQYLIQETNYVPWKAAINNFDYLSRKLSEGSVSELYKTHLLKLVTPIYKTLGFNEKFDDEHLVKLLRMYINDFICNLEHHHCIQTSLSLFDEWKRNSSKPIQVNLRRTVYCIAVKLGPAENWDILYNLYFSSNSEAEKAVILTGLGCTTNTDQIDKLLSLAITHNSGIKSEDSTSVFTAVYSSSPYGVQKTLQFISKNFQHMYDYYKDYNTIKTMIKKMLPYISTPKLISELENLVNTTGKNISGIESLLQSFVTQTRQELNWMETYKPKIQNWLIELYSENDYRLPKNVFPIRYTIKLIPYLEPSKFTFDGTVNITMNVLEDTSTIVLHANQLNISEIVVYEDTTKSPIEVLSYNFGSYHKLNIFLKTAVKPGAVLNAYLRYTGILNNKMEGFYRSSYEDDAGNTHWLATTQFEKYGARQAFPCFDEPAFKAKFIISIKRTNNYHSLSNMPLIKSTTDSESNWTWDHYQETVLMSSYLVAFIVSDFDYIESNGPPINYKVWVRPNAVKHASHALEIGQKSLKFLEDYTGLKYTLPKIDFVAVPDFAAGAMENWGLITFREYGLLADPKITPTSYIRYLETTVTHELAHMWFGNLVTCDWWEYVWLNEGFAQYFDWFVMDKLQPESRLMEQFVVYEMQVALLKDSFIHMRPMNNKLKDPYDDGKDFTTIAYKKSSSIIRMMEHSFGKEVFHEALKLYLNENQNKTSIPLKLWSAMQTKVNAAGGIQGTNKSVEALMKSWTDQSGYPVVRASIVANTLTLIQERFLITGRNTSSKELYWIPITITTKSNPNFVNTLPTLWLGSKGTTVTNLLNLQDEWIILNVQQTGFYRVNYDLNIWTNLIWALNTENFGGIPEINRAQIIDDLLNLARADYITYDLALTATGYLAKERGHLPWKAFFSAVSFLYTRFDGQIQYQTKFSKYLSKLITPIFEDTGFEQNPNDTQMNKLNRDLILPWACKLNNPDCVILARKLFNDFRGNSAKVINPDTKFAVFCTALRYGDFSDWEFVLQQYRASNFESEKIVFLKSLGCTRNETAINKLLTHAISRDGWIRDQNVGIAFSAVYSADSWGVNATLNFLINNYQGIYKYYGSWSSVAQLISNVAEKISTDLQIEKLKLFIQDKKEEFSEIQESLNETILQITKNNEWYMRHVDAIEAWLNNQKIITTTEASPDPGAATSIYVNNIILVFSVFHALTVIAVTSSFNNY